MTRGLQMESREQTLQSGKKRNAMRKDLRMNGGASTGFGAVGKLLLAVAGLLGVAFFPVREARGADSAVAVWSDFAMSLTSGDYTIVLGEGTTVDDDGAIVMHHHARCRKGVYGAVLHPCRHIRLFGRGN